MRAIIKEILLGDGNKTISLGIRSSGGSFHDSFPTWTDDKKKCTFKKNLKEALDTCVLTHDALDLNAQTV